jgi:hypothetical protein
VALLFVALGDYCVDTFIEIVSGDVFEQIYQEFQSLGVLQFVDLT